MRPARTLLVAPESRNDLRRCADIWLTASLKAHDFVPASFWKSRYEAMIDTYLPSARVRMTVENDKILGFSASGQETLFALFVEPFHWSKGLGRLLLKELIPLYRRLELSVYEKNLRALTFYEKSGFTRQRKAVCLHTGEYEIIMERLRSCF